MTLVQILGATATAFYIVWYVDFIVDWWGNPPKPAAVTGYEGDDPGLSAVLVVCDGLGFDCF
jgi:hypothetical protein